MTIELNSADALRRNWTYIVNNDLIPQLIAEGVIEKAFQAAINGDVVWREYNGRIDVKAVYRAYGEIIADASPYLTVQLPPMLVHQIAGLAITQHPPIAEALIQLNGGTMPPIRPPVNIPVDPVAE